MRRGSITGDIGTKDSSRAVGCRPGGRSGHGSGSSLVSHSRQGECASGRVEPLPGYVWLATNLARCGQPTSSSKTDSGVAPITADRLGGFLLSTRKGTGRSRWTTSSTRCLPGCRAGMRYSVRWRRPRNHVASSRRLRSECSISERGLIHVAAAHISRTEAGDYLLIGPCTLSADGRAAPANDRRLGPRPPNRGRGPRGLT
jgi:hypothetical protein